MWARKRGDGVRAKELRWDGGRRRWGLKKGIGGREGSGRGDGVGRGGLLWGGERCLGCSSR